MSVEKTGVVIILKQPSPVQIMIHKNSRECGILNYLGSKITNDANVHGKLISWQKQLSIRRRLFIQQIGLKFKAETSIALGLDCSFVWC